MASAYDRDQAVACVVWAALGDPASAIRWKAAHAAHTLLALDRTSVLEHLRALATRELDPAPFLDPRLEFYEKHARQWLVYALARASVDDLARGPVTRFVPVLKRILDTTPHAVNTPLARDILLRLHNAGHIALPELDRVRVEKLGTPVAIVRHAWGTPPRAVSSLGDLAPGNGGWSRPAEDAVVAKGLPRRRGRS